MDRAKLAKEYYDGGYNCAQAVGCAFADVIGMDVEQIAPLLACFGGGFRAGEVCGVVSGAAMALGAKWPHKEAADAAAKELSAAKIKEFNKRFLERFPSLRCADIKELPIALEKSPAAQRLGVEKVCSVYIVAAVEIVEEMMAE